MGVRRNGQITTGIPGTGSGCPRTRGSSSARPKPVRLCAMCFKNQEVFVSEGVELLLLDDRYGRKVGLCRLASQHCNPAVSC